MYARRARRNFGILPLNDKASGGGAKRIGYEIEYRRIAPDSGNDPSCLSPLVPAARFELATACPQAGCTTQPRLKLWILWERAVYKSSTGDSAGFKGLCVSV